jgi:hypothetical protein
LNSVIWRWIHKTVVVWLSTLRSGVRDAVLYVSDGATKASDMLDMRDAIAGPNTVNASKQVDMERIQNADRATLSF